VLHPANVVDKSALGIPPILLRENEGRQTVRVPGTPATQWPLVERDDLAQLYCLALEKGRAGEEYVGASEQGVAVRKLAGVLARHWNLSGEITYESVGYWMKKYGSWARGYALNQVMRSHKAIRELGWAPAFKINA
jgi:nucleoside-diphosphate-sugar epimerase